MTTLLPFYDVMTKLMGVTKIHRELVEHADLRDGHRVLEVGAGTGNLSVLAKRTCRESRSRRRTRSASAPPRPPEVEEHHVRTGLCRGPAVRGRIFDRVLSSLMLHHLGDDLKATALAGIRRVTAPGGTLLVADLVGHGHGFTGHKAMQQAAFADDVPSLLRDAGFSVAEEVGRRSGRLGTVAFWRGVR